VVGGPQVVYVLDLAGRALSVPGYIASIAYDERGRLEEVQAQNGVRTVNSYGPTMALDSITTTSPTTELLQSLVYVRDRLGRVVTVEDGAAEPGAPSASATYAYDALGRLTVAVLEPGRSREETITYEYDGPGRLLSRRSALGAAGPAHLGTYEYSTSPGHPGAPAKVGSTDLRYDEAGNLIQRGPVRFEWNHQSRLIAAWRGNERLFVAGFAADLDRVKKVERGQTTYYLGPDVEVRDGMVILTMRINGQRVVRLETEALAASALSDLAPGGGPDGRITAADALLAHRAGGASNGGSGADVPPWHQALASAARRQSSGAPEVATYWHGDHLGTVSVSTDESAQLRQRSLHYPFGALRHATYHISEEYGFAGLEQDYGTGDLHAKARNYSPDVGIWLKPDPKFLAIDGEDLEKSLSAVLSRYAYASDDPANRTDPSGLEDVGSWEALRGSGMPPKALEQMAGALIEDTVTKGQSILGGQLDFSTHGYQVQLSARAYGLRKVLETADATYTVTIGEASASFSNYNTPAASAAVVTMERKSKDEFAIIKSVKVSLIAASTGGMVKLKMEAPSWSKHAGKSVSLSPGSPGEVKLGFSKVGIGNISVTVSASNFMRKYKKDRVRDHRKTKSWLPPRG
jgi:RHS repeat-associated protein